jgi:Uma2 family endonuclease
MALPESELLVMVEEYLISERAREERHEYLDGFVYAMAGETEAHGIICTNLTVAIGTRIKGRDCIALSKDMKVRSGPAPVSPRAMKGFFSYPDLVVVCGERKYHDKNRDVLLNPTVIIEVLSESTGNFDRGEKFLRYRTWLPSLRDYLLVEQNKALVEHYVRESETVWRLTELRGLESEAYIGSLSSSLPLAEIYDRITFPAATLDDEPVSEEAQP